jgi:hypothetical protein
MAIVFFTEVFSESQGVTFATAGYYMLLGFEWLVL